MSRSLRGAAQGRLRSPTAPPEGPSPTRPSTVPPPVQRDSCVLHSGALWKAVPLFTKRFFTEFQADFRGSLQPIQPPPSLSSGNHRLSWNRHRCLKKDRMMEKKHYTEPPHVSNEYTPQLLALFCIFYIFTYTRYFQTSLCLFKTPSETCLAKQIQCKYIYWMTLACIVFKMH